MYGVRNAAHAESLSMLPFAGDPSAPRPIGCARVSDNWLFQCATAEEVYDKLGAIYPQLQVPRVEREALEYKGVDMLDSHGVYVHYGTRLLRSPNPTPNTPTPTPNPNPNPYRIDH